MSDDRLTGIRLGGYHLIRRLGRGGMATVYLARDDKLQREVAVKVLHGIDATDETFQARFQQEALATARLQHPNIVTIYDYGHEGDYTYMVMEYCPNGSLHEVLLRASQEGRLLEQDYIITVVSQIAQALDFAHHHGIIHRDVKPSNILFARDGRPVLADLGVAKAFTGPKLTRTLAAIGTPEYMSPEQGRGEEVDHRTDLYSLGVVLYELLSGRPPYSATTPWGIINQHISESLPPIRQHNPAVSPGMAAVVAKAMAKAPADRFQSGQEFAAALRAQTALGRDTAPVIGPPPVAPGPRVTPAPPAKRRGSGLLLVIIGLALALVAVLAVAAFMVVPGLRSETATATAPAPVVAVAASPTFALTASSTPTSTPAAPEVAPSATVAEAITPTEPTAAASPTSEPSSTTTPTIARATTAAASPTPPAATPTPGPTAKPQTQPASTGPAAVLDFETFGDWRRGNEPHGTFTQSSERVAEGSFAAKLAYDMPAADNNYVVFRRALAAAIAGQPAALTIQVFGDGAGHFLNAWIQDSAGEVRQFTFGQINHDGEWQPMTLALDTTAPWPQGHISGPDNGSLDFPIKLNALVLDAVADTPVSGIIYVDNLQGAGAATAATGGTAATSTPKAGAAIQPTTPAAPASALSGRIIFTAGTGGGARLMAVDAATGSAWDVAANAAQPDIRSDGRVIYNGVGGGRDNLFAVNPDGSQGRMVSMHPEDSFPGWSPSGASVVFHSSLQGDGNDRIYVQWNADANEEPAALLVGGQPILGRYPTWLQNWRVAYSGCDYGFGSGSNCGIWTVESNGSGNPVQITQRLDDRSTDTLGGMVLYTSQASGNWDIYTVPATGGGSANLTNSPSQDVNATYSPDGKHIAFLSDRDGRWGIWVMGIDGSNPRRLADAPPSDWDRERLAWGP